MKMKTPNSTRAATALRIVKVTTVSGANEFQGLLVPNSNVNNSSTTLSTINDNVDQQPQQQQQQQHTITIESIIPTKTTNSISNNTATTAPTTNTINNNRSLVSPTTPITVTTTSKLINALSSSSSSASARKKFNRFSDAEKSVLFSMFKEYQSIIDIKHRKHSYSSHKQSEVRNCWDLILSRFNAHSDTKKRTMRQVQKFWLNSKLRNSLPKELFVPIVTKMVTSTTPPLPIIATTTTTSSQSESSTPSLSQQQSQQQQQPPPLTSISNCTTTLPNDSKTITRITKTEYLDITNGDYILGTPCGVSGGDSQDDVDHQSHHHHQEMEIEVSNNIHHNQEQSGQIMDDEHDVDDEADDDDCVDDVGGDETSRMIELKFIETDQSGSVTAAHINHHQHQQQQQHQHASQGPPPQQQQIRLTTLQIHPTHDGGYTMDTSNLESKNNLQLHHHHHHQIAIPVPTTANEVEPTMVPSRRLFCGSDCGDGNLDDDNHKMLTTTTTVEEKLSTTSPSLFNAGQQQEQNQQQQQQQHQLHQQQQQQQQQHPQLPVQQPTAVGYIDLITYEEKMNTFRLQEIEYRVKESQLRCDLQRLAVSKAQEEIKQMREIHSLRIREMQLKLDRMKKDLRHINNYDHDDLGN